jgi:hypothetical protein
VASGWLVLWNVFTFGSPNPYRMPPSEVSLPAATWAAFMTLLGAFSGAGHFLEVIPGQYLLIAAGIAIAFFAWRLSRRGFVGLPRVYRGKLLLFLFLCLSLLTVVVARSTYRLSGGIGTRMFLSIYWIILLLAAMAGEWAVARPQAGRRGARRVLVAAIALLAVLQIGTSLMTFGRPALQDEQDMRALAVSLGREVPDNMLVLTDAIDPLRVFGNVNARCPARLDLGETPFTWSEIRQVGEQGRLWGIVMAATGDFQRGMYGDAFKDIAADPARYPELREQATRGKTRVFKYIKDATDGRQGQ